MEVAAILQQTAEYIYSLEQEKTRLLSQNCQLKRTIDQQDHNGTPDLSQNTTQIVSSNTTNGTVVVSQQQQLISNVGTGGSGQPGATVVATVAKKRKIDTIVTMQPVSDSSDEGLGSMSPEPVSLRAVSVTSNGSNLSNAHSGTTTISSPSTHGRQCSTVNFSAKDFLELKHQLEVERRQKMLVEDRLKVLERQLQSTRIQYQDTSELVVPDISNEPSTVSSLAPEDVAVSIIHKPVGSGATVAGKLSRLPAELEGGMQVISLDTNNLGKNQHVVVCSGELIEEALTMQTVPAAPKQLVIPLKEEKLYIKRSRSRSPTAGEATMVTLPPKKNRYPSILEAAIKAEPKVEVERIDSPSSIVVTDDQMMVSTTGSHLVGAGTNLTSVQQPRINSNYHRHNLETIVEAIRHLEGDAFDAVVPTQQQQQQQQSLLHQPVQQPQPTQPPTATSQSTIQQRPMQEVPLALTTASKQQALVMQTKTDRDHRQSQLEPYLKFRTAPNAAASGLLPTANSTNLAGATASNVMTVTPQAGSIISVSIAPPGSSTLPAGSNCHSPAAASSTTTTTIVTNSSVVSAHMPQQQQHSSTLTTAAQLLQQQQQCRPASHKGSNSVKSKTTPLLVSVSSNLSKLRYGSSSSSTGGGYGAAETTVSAIGSSSNGGCPNVVITYQKTMDGA
uniref:BHLH domain-containing protein n=1 Tax=Anopheles culicifacies TaxID=139723 RepID=A0A182MFT7_9DIPT